MNKKGFTLIELLIVVAIIGLLATLAIISLTSAQAKARDTKRIADVKSMQNALEMYFNDNAAYPTSTTWATLQTILAPTTGTQYLTSLPATPVTSTATEFYAYAVNGTTNKYCLMSILEKTGNQMENQDIDTDNCTTGTPAAVANTYGVGLTSLDCDDSGSLAYPICLGN